MIHAAGTHDYLMIFEIRTLTEEKIILECQNVWGITARINCYHSNLILQEFKERRRSLPNIHKKGYFVCHSLYGNQLNGCLKRN